MASKKREYSLPVIKLGYGYDGKKLKTRDECDRCLRMFRFDLSDRCYECNAATDILSWGDPVLVEKLYEIHYGGKENLPWFLK